MIACLSVGAQGRCRHPKDGHIPLLSSVSHRQAFAGTPQAGPASPGAPGAGLGSAPQPGGERGGQRGEITSLPEQLLGFFAVPKLMLLFLFDVILPSTVLFNAQEPGPSW